MDEAPADNSTRSRRAAETSTSDYPPQLGKTLAKLKASWLEDQDQIHAWHAVDLCNSWSSGPYQLPLWCVPVAGRLAAAIMGSPPRGPILQRRVMGALDMTSRGRNRLKNQHNEISCMMEAGMFDIYRTVGASPSWIYRALSDEAGIEPSDSGAERRRLQNRVAKGRRLLKRLSNAPLETDDTVADPVQRLVNALTNGIIALGSARSTILLCIRLPDGRHLLYTSGSIPELVSLEDFQKLQDVIGHLDQWRREQSVPLSRSEALSSFVEEGVELRRRSRVDSGPRRNKPPALERGNSSYK
jgi:hypothetical protein